MNQNTRIELNDNIMSIFMKMSGGNTGALNVCMSLFKEAEKIDPDGAMGGFGALLLLDSFAIYEHRIWMFYKDVCGENLVKTLALLRAVQLGKMGESSLSFAIDNYGKGIDVDAALEQVMEALPNFNKVKEVVSEP